MSAIFDTNIIINHLKSVPAAKKILEEYSGNEKVGICSVTAYGLAIGTKNSYEEDSLSVFLSHAEIYPLDLKSAREVVVFYKKLRDDGSQLSIADTLILGTANANDEVFVTLDMDLRIHTKRS